MRFLKTLYNPEQTLDVNLGCLSRPNGDKFEIPSDCLALAFRGSVAHGMYVAPEGDGIDDIDLMGFCVGGLGDYFGLTEWGSRGTKEVKSGSYDVVLYELRKAVSLLLQGNPNILSMLWVNDGHFLKKHWIMDELRKAKHWFAGKHVYNAFAGYAHAQLLKMESRDPAELRLYLAVTAELKHRGIHPNQKGVVTEFSNRESGEDKDVANWDDDKLLQRMKSFQKKGENLGYLGDKRKRLVLEHGYDSKNAAHLVRLLRMCKEFMEDGELRVDRTNIDAQELLDIKKGKWKLDNLKAYSNQLFEECRQARYKSDLPEEPSRPLVELLLVDCLQEYFNEEGSFR